MLKVLSMMGLVSDERGEVGRAGEFAMEVLEAVQYNTHPIDQVGLLGIFFSMICIILDRAYSQV